MCKHLLWLLLLGGLMIGECFTLGYDHGVDRMRVVSSALPLDTIAPEMQDQTFNLFSGQLIKGSLQLQATDDQWIVRFVPFVREGIVMDDQGNISGLMPSKDIVQEITVLDTAGNAKKANLTLSFVKLPEKVVITPRYYGEVYSPDEILAKVQSLPILTAQGSGYLGDISLGGAIAEQWGDESLVPVTLTNKYGQTVTLNAGVSFIYRKLKSRVHPYYSGDTIRIDEVVDLQTFNDGQATRDLLSKVTWKSPAMQRMTPAIANKLKNNESWSRKSRLILTYKDATTQEQEITLQRNPYSARNNPLAKSGVVLLPGQVVAPADLIVLTGTDIPLFTREGNAPSSDQLWIHTATIKITYADESRDLVPVVFQVAELTGMISNIPTDRTNQSVDITLKTNLPIATPSGRTALGTSQMLFSKLMDANETGIVLITTGTAKIQIPYLIDKIDKQGPKNLTLSSVGGKTIVKDSSVQITFSARDELSGIKTYQCKLNTSTRFPCQDVARISNLEEGENILGVRAIDVAWNSSLEKTLTITRDTVAPSIDTIYFKNSGIYRVRRNRDFTLDFSLLDNNKIELISVDGLPAGLTTNASTNSGTLKIMGKIASSGRYPIRIIVVDKAWNTATLHFTLHGYNPESSSRNEGSFSKSNLDYCSDSDLSGSSTEAICIKPESKEAKHPDQPKEEEKSEINKGYPEIRYSEAELFNPSIVNGQCYTRRPLQAILNSGVITTSDEFKKALSFFWSYEMTKYKDVEGFDPFRNLSREEAAKVFSNFAINVLCRKPDLNLKVNYSDTENANPELKPYITLAYQLGVMKGSGMGTGDFRPFDKITKAEVNAVLIRMILKSYLDESQTVDWYQKYNQVSADLKIITQGAGQIVVSRHDVALMLFRAYKNQAFEWRNINYFSYVLESRARFLKE